MVKDEPKLSRLEILGAWLNLWTPPRDAHVPPIPWRALGLGALGVAVVLGIAAAVLVPVIDDAKDERAAREQRGIDRRRAVRVALQRVEQRARTGELAASADRARQLAAIQVAIGRDARSRFSPKARAATCEPAAGQDAAGGRVAYDCLSPVRDIVGSGEQRGARGTLGIPYRAVADYLAGTYAFCKVNPPPGEQVIPDPRSIVELPAPCRK